MAYRDGFTVLEGFLVVAVVAILGTVGYLSYVNLWGPSATPSADKTTTVTMPTKVETTEDLDKASAALDDVSLEDNDSAEFDKAVSNF